MHVMIVGLYGATIHLSCLAYTLIVGGPFWLVVACGPFIISGAMLSIWALSYAICKLHTRLSKSEKSDARA